MQDISTSIVTAPASAADIRTYTFGDQGAVPNNPALPVVCMGSAVSKSAGAAAIRGLLEANGWGGTWQWTVFDFHHYHPNAHEALVVASGSADLVLGGPGGETLHVEAGDALVLPAGTGHCRAGASPDFQICGAYPPGQEDYDTLGADDPRPSDIAQRVERVPRPTSDPIYGAEGPLTELWGGR